MAEGIDPASAGTGETGAVTERRTPPTIKDVARIAQVSVTTVSHALSAKRHVSAETAARVQAAIEFTGYVPHSAARNLQAGRSSMLGVVVPDVSDPFFGGLARGCESFADDHGYGVIISSGRNGNGRRDRHFDLLRSRSIDGLIYVAGDARRDQELVELARTYPIVLADESTDGLDGIPLISADHRRGGTLVGEHLRDLGHHEVAVVTGPRGLHSTEERLAGFTSIFPDAIVIDGDFSEEVGYHRTGRLLARDVRPTAIFASNDNTAFGVIDAVSDRGLRVPDDLSVVGFDDVGLARRSTPALTTVRQPISEIGRQAARTLIAMLSGEDLPPTVPQQVELVVRGSTAAPRRR